MVRPSVVFGRSIGAVFEVSPSYAAILQWPAHIDLTPEHEHQAVIVLLNDGPFDHHGHVLVDIAAVAIESPRKRIDADRAGTCSIRINDQWRLCFRFEAGHAFDVEIVDYH